MTSFSIKKSMYLLGKKCSQITYSELVFIKAKLIINWNLD